MGRRINLSNRPCLPGEPKLIRVTSTQQCQEFSAMGCRNGAGVEMVSNVLSAKCLVAQAANKSTGTHTHPQHPQKLTTTSPPHASFFLIRF